jgi:hypothetical protein
VWGGVRACVHACVRACVRACVSVRVRACVCGSLDRLSYHECLKRRQQVLQLVHSALRSRALGVSPATQPASEAEILDKFIRATYKDMPNIKPLLRSADHRPTVPYDLDFFIQRRTSTTQGKHAYQTHHENINQNHKNWQGNCSKDNFLIRKGVEQ